MIGAIAINIVMVLLALGIGSGIFPATVFSGVIGVLRCGDLDCFHDGHR